MGTFTYENQGTYTFLIYTADMDEEIDSVAVGMTTNNKLEGIISPGIQQKNMRMVYKFNITSMTAMEDVLLSVLNQKKLVAMIESMAKCILYSQQYLLTEENFLLDPAHIYVNVSTGETSLIVSPVVKQDGMSFQNFLKELLNSVISDESEDCTYIVKIRNYINKRDGFSYEGLLDTLNKLGTPNNSVYARADIPQAKPQPQVTPTPVATAPQQNVAPQPSAQPVAPKAPVPPMAPQGPAVGTGAKPMIPPVPNNGPKPGMSIPGTPNGVVAGATQAKPEKEKGFGLGKLFGKKEKEAPEKKEASPLGFAYPGQTSGNPNVDKKYGSMAIPGKSNMNIPPVVPPQQNVAPQPQKPVMPQTQPQQRTPMATPVQNTVPQQATPAYAAPQQQAPSYAAPVAPAPRASYVEEDYGNTIMMTDDDEAATVLLSGDDTVMQDDNAEKRVYITREKNQQKLEITKPLFKIGRSADTADLYVAGNGMIGREHAFIIVQDQSVYVKDNNSKNHTYVNDVMVNAGERIELKDQDVVRLADENFIISIQ